MIYVIWNITTKTSFFSFQKVSLILFRNNVVILNRFTKSSECENVRRTLEETVH